MILDFPAHHIYQGWWKAGKKVLTPLLPWFHRTQDGLCSRNAYGANPASPDHLRRQGVCGGCWPGGNGLCLLAADTAHLLWVGPGRRCCWQAARRDDGSPAWTYIPEVGDLDPKHWSWCFLCPCLYCYSFYSCLQESLLFSSVYFLFVFFISATPLLLILSNQSFLLFCLLFPRFSLSPILLNSHSLEMHFPLSQFLSFPLLARFDLIHYSNFLLYACV